MKTNLTRIGIGLVVTCLMGLQSLSVVAAPAGGTFEIGAEDFLLNGQPYVIHSGEMHYPRIPRPYWAHRLRMARAMGLNTVSTYVFWNVHEPRQGEFDFDGNADVAEFCRLAHAEGLLVIIRPGPYVCGEWDLGGLPWWLLQDGRMRLRSSYPPFLAACRRYFEALGEELAPLQIDRGGPIIMVQVENEYGGYGQERAYLAALKDALREAGFSVPFFSSEMTWSLRPAADAQLFQTVGLGRDPEDQYLC